MIERNKYYKRCRKCGEIKDIDLFNHDNRRKDKHKDICRECSKKYSIQYEATHKERRKRYNKQYNEDYYPKNREKVILKMKEYYNTHKDKFKEYNILHKGDKHIYMKLWREQNWEEIKKYYNEYTRLKLKTDPNFKFGVRLRVRICSLLKSKKQFKTVELIGCSIQELKNHLQNQFKDGMSWDNNSYYGWHLDHIKPVSLFDLTDPIQQKECFHYTNLQPLWWWENLTKSNKYECK